ncbi:MAG TPA: 50S ribosomal protein L29 [Candidatus Gastranaerophilaceae bacterium]|nr:50S ribosomal protein L29 [Candidatus Gastranaerophilaceae bacterium]HPT40836.1 50S ribosomal protein L29 [Candidatus Gastranaerophilaceae bacterium]
MKLTELREKTIEELNGVVTESKKQLFDLRIQKATHKLENTALIDKTKRLIAQAKTILKEKS